MVVAVGQRLSYTDSTGKVIRVGDVVKTSKGEYWDINKYLQAVPRHAAMAIDVSVFVRQYPNRIILANDESEKVGRVLGVPEVVRRKEKKTIAERPKEKKHTESNVVNGFKVCAHCGEMKETKDFSRSAKNLDGLQAWCKQCINNFYKEKGTSRRKNKKA